MAKRVQRIRLQQVLELIGVDDSDFGSDFDDSVSDDEAYVAESEIGDHDDVDGDNSSSDDDEHLAQLASSDTNAGAFRWRKREFVQT